jgi:probable HAF family extracellular repeat protein
MKTRYWARFTANLLVLLATCAVAKCGFAQSDSPQSRGPRYRLIDLGTFGGPASYFQNGLDGILNNRGVAVGWSNTPAHDPFDPFCISVNCFAAHAFQFKNGMFRDLGTLPGGASSQAQWISSNGLIAGLSDNGATDPTAAGFPELRAVLWRRDQIVDLGTLPEGGFQSIANAVNNRGQVVGLAVNTTPDLFSFVGLPSQTRAFLWQNGVMQDLGTLGGPDAIAGLINDQGEITGPSYLPIDPATGAPAAVHPFFWKNGTMIDIGSLGGTDSEPTSMNARGEVVGYSTLAGDATSHPFLWRRGKLRDLGTLGGNSGTTNWINDQGDIAGKADLAGAAPQLHDAVLWRNGKMVDLGVLPGDSCSNAYYVNSRGQVVGTSENLDLCLIPTGQRAFLWEKGGPMVDLNTLIPPGADLDLTFAVSINDRGEIAGFGVPAGCAPQDYESCGHAYILMPCVEERECTNEALGNAGPFADTPLRANSARPVSLTPTLSLKSPFHQKVHFPGQRAVPSD